MTVTLALAGKTGLYMTVKRYNIVEILEPDMNNGPIVVVLPEKEKKAVESGNWKIRGAKKCEGCVLEFECSTQRNNSFRCLKAGTALQ